MLQIRSIPKKFYIPEYSSVAYVPFTSVNTPETHIYGFVNRPRPVRLIAGLNFLEDGPYGKQTNPQAVFIEYEFGPMREGTLDDRNRVRKKFLDEEFTKPLSAFSAKYSDRMHYVEHACNLLHKSKKEVAILDIGCGLGRILNVLRLDGFQNLYGIDMDSNSITVLQEVCRKNKVSEITSAIVNMNSENVEETIRLKLNQNSFDIILLHATLEHIPSPEKTPSHYQIFVGRWGSGSCHWNS
jgi:hypothetical protein